MNRGLSKLCFWLLANKRSINAVKSKFMVIASPHNMSKLVDKPEIKVLGKSCEQVTSIEYLGLTMNQYLRRDKHVEALGKKLKSAISSINPVKPGLFEICQTRGGDGIHPRPVTPLFEG